MSREVTAEEVREFAENCGWQNVYTMETYPLMWGTSPHSNSKLIGRREALPDFLHDLNACFEALEWFCKQRAWWFYVANTYTVTESGFARTDITKRSCGIRGTRSDHLSRTELIACEGASTIQEAIIHAVTAASKARTL